MVDVLLVFFRSSIRSGGGDSAQFESMFGMARRFPSIRVGSSEKKERKKNRDYENFPRTSGEAVAMSFGSLDQLYSKPEKPSSAGKVGIDEVLL